MLQDYVITGRIIPGTLIARIIDLGISPVRAAIKKIIIDPQLPENGITDSLYALLSSENFLRSRGSLEREFLQLLTRSFINWSHVLRLSCFIIVTLSCLGCMI